MQTSLNVSKFPKHVYYDTKILNYSITAQAFKKAKKEQIQVVKG